MENKKKVIFLDRDGVLCKEKSYITGVQQLEVFCYASEAVGILHSLGYAVIVITNQSGVARGMIDENELLRINDKLIKETKVDDIFFCPHLPPKEGESEIPPYIINCSCRKPGTKLLKDAVAKHNLTLEGAFFVGDRASDIETGEKAGITTVLLESGYGSERLEKPVIADFKFNDLMEFAKYLKEKQHAVQTI